MKRIRITFILLILSPEIFACLNYYVINERGQAGIYDNYYPYTISSGDNSKSYLRELKWYAKRIPKMQGIEKVKYISNYTFYLVRLGRHKEALPILQKLAIENPSEYEVLSNLATTYELNGSLTVH